MAKNNKFPINFPVSRELREPKLTRRAKIFIDFLHLAAKTLACFYIASHSMHLIRRRRMYETNLYYIA